MTDKMIKTGAEKPAPKNKPVKLTADQKSEKKARDDAEKAEQKRLADEQKAKDDEAEKKRLEEENRLKAELQTKEPGAETGRYYTDGKPVRYGLMRVEFKQVYAHLKPKDHCSFDTDKAERLISKGIAVAVPERKQEA